MIFGKSSYITVNLELNNEINEVKITPVGRVEGLQITFNGLRPLMCSRDTKIVTNIGIVRASDLCVKTAVSTAIGNLFPISIRPAIFDGVRLSSNINNATFIINGVYVIT